MIKELKTLMRNIADNYAKEFEDVSNFIFHNPELGGGEIKSSQFLVDFMKKHGFQITHPYAGEPTGFRAEIGNGRGPTIAFLAEYDALPGYGDNGEPAHACGHNWIAAVTAGSAVVLSKMIDKLNGTIVLIGTPAEENLSAKVSMIKNGGFDDIDVALQAHPDQNTEITPGALALSAYEFHFKGKAAHAAQFPHQGINALDAVQLTFSGINALRQHIPSDVRIHGIVTAGGAAVNVVPDKCSCHFQIRAKKRSTVELVSEKVKNCALGASLMTGATCHITMPEPMLYDLINVPILTRLAEENLMENGILKVHREEISPGSSDIGNVSYVCPTCYIEVGLDDVNFRVHDREALKYADSHHAYTKLHQVIKGMSSMAIDLLETPAFVEQAKKEHKLILQMPAE